MPLILAATPIGNHEDASPRLREILATADVVAAEDTRRLRRLTAALGVNVSGRIVSYYDAVEATRTESLLAELQAGRTVVLVSDAGMPLVSDPGHRLLAAAVAAGVDVSVVPGPSAVLAALAVSGLPADRWVFEGFLPRRAGERRSRIADLAAERRTLVFFEAPHRLAACLGALADGLGPTRPAVVARELTKTHEEVRRGTLAELADWAADGVRGEVTLVVAGAAAVAHSEADAVADVGRRMAEGMSRRDAVAAVAAGHGMSRRALYNATTDVERQSTC